MSNNYTQKILFLSCGREHTVKKWIAHNRKQKHKCKTGDRQFVENTTNQKISSETKEMIESLLLDKFSLADITRTMKISNNWLQKYVNKKYAEITRQVQISEKTKRKITVSGDEIQSFVESKNKKQWIWLALDKETKEIVGVYIGKKDKNAAQKMWESLPPVYRECAVCYTYFLEYDREVIPSKRHKPVDKKTGLTNHIERFNNTMRQRISRLVRKTLSFSKKLDNHKGAIWNFIHHYNESLSLSG